MAKHKVAELEGALLDVAVAKAEERMPSHGWSTPDQSERCNSEPPLLGQFERFCSDWGDGGPIIERERIATTPAGSEWAAFKQVPGADGGRHWAGPTPLIAAMRAYVASKFGDEVELP